MIITPESYLLVNKILVILIVAISFWLGFWVYFTDKKNKLDRTFFFWVISTSLWIFLYYLLISSKEVLMAVVWAKIGLGVVSLFFIPFYFFFIYFLNLEKRLRILNIIVLINSVIFFVISIFSNLVVKDVEFKKIGVDIILGRGSLGIYLSAIFLAIFVLTLLLKNYFKVNLQEKLKIQYILVGVFIWALMNSIFNIFPAILFGKNTPLAPLGNLSFIFLLGFTAYAIVKRELFGIKVVVASIFVVLIAILMSLDALLFTEVFAIQALKGIALAIFLVFGYMLIRSVSEEVKRREELEKLNRAKSEFISMASHQLRTPLTAIKGYSSMMLEGIYGKIEPKGERVLRNISISTERLIKIVNDLLNLSRVELGKLELDKKPTKIEKLIEEVHQEMKPVAEAKNLEFVLEKPKTSLPELNIDPLKIRQVVYNLIDNAIKYTEKGKISIKIERIKSKIRVIISDTGRGFTEEERSKLFQLFVRGEAGIDSFIEGTGIGLSVAKKFIELHNGTIQAESEGKDKGATFYFELPIEQKRQ